MAGLRARVSNGVEYPVVALYAILSSSRSVSFAIVCAGILSFAVFLGALVKHFPNPPFRPG